MPAVFTGGQKKHSNTIALVDMPDDCSPASDRFIVRVWTHHQYNLPHIA